MNQQHHPLYQELGGIVGYDYVRDDKMSLVTYSKDMSSNPAVLSGVIVRPGTTEEISEIVKLANRTGYPVTLRGGGESANGVTKGVPHRNIVIDMGRLSDVTDIDITNQCVTFGGGIRPSQLDDALKPHGYFAHTVLGPYYTDSMGGLISGVQGGGYPKDMTSAGLNWHYILGLKVVLPTGEVVTTGAGPDSNFNRDKIYYREASSPDLTGLFISGGGTFGIITEITMRIFRIPPVMKAVGYVFTDLDSCWAAQLELSEHYPTPHTNLFLSDTETLKRFGSNPEGDYCMLFSVETDSEEDAAIRMKKIADICTKHGGVMGDARTNMFAGIGMTGQCKVVRATSSQVCPFLSWESLFQRSDAKEMLMKLDALFHEDKEGNAKYHASRVFYTMPVENFVLMGITMHWDDNIPGAGEYVLEIWKKGADLLNKCGSCSAYTQGNNSKKIAEAWTPAYYGLMKSLKKTLDPNNIMCPGLWNI